MKNFNNIIIIFFIITSIINIFATPQPISIREAKKIHGNNAALLADNIKNIIVYYETGLFEQKIEIICNQALKQFEHAEKNIPFSKPPIVIFDIDETALSNYELCKQYQFHSTSEDAYQFRLDKKCTGIKPVLDFQKKLVLLGYKIFFISSRRETLRQATLENLMSAGYQVDELILMPMSLYNTAPHGAWKNLARQMLSLAYNILGSIGDSDSDFEGGNCGIEVRLPNYLY